MASNAESDKLKEELKRKQAAVKELIDNEECALKKRLPRKLPKRDCDVYVSRKTDFKQQLKRCQKILDNGNLVCIHGLGQAINRAINLALQLQASGLGTVELETHTSTVELVDDIEPLNDDHEPDTLGRSNSAVHIRVFRPDLQSAMDELSEIERVTKSVKT